MKRFLWTGWVLAAACLYLATTAVPALADYEYAAKFLCGTADGKQATIARGVYGTVINVHNPIGEASLQYKVAVALREKQGNISKFKPLKLGPDGALFIDCMGLEGFASGNAIVEGFVVIQSKVELDVVAAYTSARTATTPMTLFLERVPARKMP